MLSHNERSVLCNRNRADHFPFTKFMHLVVTNHDEESVFPANQVHGKNQSRS